MTLRCGLAGAFSEPVGRGTDSVSSSVVTCWNVVGVVQAFRSSPRIFPPICAIVGRPIPMKVGNTEASFELPPINLAVFSSP